MEGTFSRQNRDLGIRSLRSQAKPDHPMQSRTHGSQNEDRAHQQWLCRRLPRPPGIQGDEESLDPQKGRVGGTDHRSGEEQSKSARTLEKLDFYGKSGRKMGF